MIAKNICKIIVGIITGAIVLFIINIITSFTGNPISASIAESKINEYIEAEYSFIRDLDYKEKKAKYNFKFGCYGKYVQSASSPDTGFYVYYSDGKVDDEYEGYVLGKFNTFSRLTNEFDDIVEKIIEEGFPYETDMVIAGIAKEEDGIKQLELDMPLDIHNLPAKSELTVYVYANTISYEVLRDRLVELDLLMKKNDIRIDIYSVVIEEPRTENEKHGERLHLFDFPAEYIASDNLIETIKTHQKQWEDKHEK